MSLEPDEIKAVLNEAKSDTPRNAARKELVSAFELMEAALAQNLPPWDRRWLEFEAIDRITAALGAGSTQDGGDADDVAARRVAGLAFPGGGNGAPEHGPVDADPGEGGAAA